MLIRCSLCGEEYNITYNWGEGVIEVAPHRCNNIDVPFVKRVCESGCPNLIRCRRDGFECREAWEASSDEDWQGGHDLYVQGDRN